MLLLPLIVVVLAACSGCGTCVSAPTLCTSCSGVAYLFDTSCVTAANCPVGTFPQPATSICQTCPTGCTVCNITACFACDTVAGYLQEGFSCVKESNCFHGKWNNNGVCQPCVGCYACSTSATTCIECSSSTFLLGAECVPACPAGMFGNTTTHTCEGK